MIESLPPAASCRACGAQLGESLSSPIRFCPHCGAAQASEWPQPDARLYPPPADQYPFAQVAQLPQPLVPQPLDPDHPRWGIWTGIGVWVFSVAALMVAGAAILIILFMIDRPQNAAEWMTQPHVVTVSVYSTILAHVVTIIFCWAVVTRLGTQPLFASLGW